MRLAKLRHEICSYILQDSSQSRKKHHHRRQVTNTTTEVDVYKPHPLSISFKVSKKI